MKNIDENIDFHLLNNEKLEIKLSHCEFTVECKLHPGGIEPQPIKLEFKIYPAELWIWVHWCMIYCWNLELYVHFCPQIMMKCFFSENLMKSRLAHCEFMVRSKIDLRWIC